LLSCYEGFWRNRSSEHIMSERSEPRPCTPIGQKKSRARLSAYPESFQGEYLVKDLTCDEPIVDA